MRFTPFPSLAAAAETRRREMPASIAIIILTGGIAAAIMHGPGAVGWAAITSLLLIFDTELYRRFDIANVEMTPRVAAALSGWAFASSAFYATLPIALWLNGQAAGAAAAIVLWVVGVVRHFSPGASGALPIAIAGRRATGALHYLCAADDRGDDLAARLGSGGDRRHRRLRAHGLRHPSARQRR